MASKLTDLQVKNAKPRPGKYTLSAGKGLTLLVMPDGSKYWRLRYRFGGKPRMITVGKPYPETRVTAAEDKAGEFRALIRKGIDPAEEQRTQRLAQKEQVANTFGQGAEAWFAFHSKAWSAKTTKQARDYLDKDILPMLRSRPLDLISVTELGALIAEIEERGAFDVAKKVRQWLKSIYSYCRAKGWTKAAPERDLSAIAQRGPKKKKFAHLPLVELPGFLRKVIAYPGSILVKGCARLSLWTANRPGVTRTVRWKELDLVAGNWIIEPGREEMKRGYFHVTPLPTQAIAMLKEIQKVTGAFEYVFIGRNDPSKPLSDGAVAGMIEAIGYRHKQTAHGFRHMISTALNEWAREKGYDSDWIERQLAHGDPDEIRDIYNEAMYLESRRKMMQEWADYQDLILLQNDPVILVQNEPVAIPAVA